MGKIPLEKEMATHSSILAWKTPWMEKPGGLQSMELQRVGHTERLHLLGLLYILETYILRIFSPGLCLIFYFSNGRIFLKF